jgi:hypothetical protein
VHDTHKDIWVNCRSVVGITGMRRKPRTFSAGMDRRAYDEFQPRELEYRRSLREER